MVHDSLREHARQIFLGTIAHLKIDETLRARVRVDGSRLTLCDLSFDLQETDRFVIIAIGKAATPMFDATFDLLSSSSVLFEKLRAVVVGTSAPRNVSPAIQYFPGQHPLPDATSLHAAQAVLHEMAACGERSFVLFLISGGASAMLEQPLDGRIAWDDAVQFHRALVASGLPITQMNALRKHFSRVKGGRLATAAAGATQCTLLVSDVPEEQVHVVASGPSLPDPSTVQDCARILEAHALRLPEAVRGFFESPDLPETPKADHPAFRRAHWRSLLSSAESSGRAVQLAESLGYVAVVDDRCDDWDYRQAARYLVERMGELRQRHGRVCLVSVGEVSVPLPQRHGSGGRNQQFTLECARILSSEQLPYLVLSAGTDGIDGNSAAAGAMTDRETFRRAASLGISAEEALATFNSGPLFRALQDDLITGPTGTNVRDLRLLLSS